MLSRSSNYSFLPTLLHSLRPFSPSRPSNFSQMVQTIISGGVSESSRRKKGPWRSFSKVKVLKQFSIPCKSATLPRDQIAALMSIFQHLLLIRLKSFYTLRRGIFICVLNSSASGATIKDNGGKMSVVTEFFLRSSGGS